MIPPTIFLEVNLAANLGGSGTCAILVNPLPRHRVEGEGDHLQALSLRRLLRLLGKFPRLFPYELARWLYILTYKVWMGSFIPEILLAWKKEQ